MTTGFLVANEQAGMEYRDQWTAAYVNDLPDSAFLYVEPGGSKDADGKTVPRSNRHFPVKDANGKPDAAHIANALARISQSNLPPAVREACMTKAKAMMAAHPNTGSGTTASYQGTAGSGRARGEVPVETRSFGLAVELRAAGDGRTLIGRAVPYGTTVQLGNGDTERFLPGAFNDQLASGQIGQVRIFDSHASRPGPPIGRTVALVDEPDGLHGEWYIPDTTRGNDALALVRSGDVTGLSVGFKPKATRRAASDGAMERVAAHLDHVALTYEPAYPDAQVTAVRSLAPQPHPAAAYRGDLLRAQGVLARLDGGR